jgi:hypothetical protein
VIIIGARYVIGGESFRYKKDVEARIRLIKDNAPFNRDIEGRDESFVRAFFALHPTKSERLADAVAIHVVRGGGLRDRRFEFYKADGTSVDASYRKPLAALTGLDHHRSSVLEGMRFTAHQQAWEWAVETFGEEAYDGDLDVHHEPPFRDLVARFLFEEGVAFADVGLLDRDGLLGSRLAPEWEVRWERFHAEHAGYELLNKNEHTNRHRAA